MFNKKLLLPIFLGLFSTSVYAETFSCPDILHDKVSNRQNSYGWQVWLENIKSKTTAVTEWTGCQAEPIMFPEVHYLLKCKFKGDQSNGHIALYYYKAYRCNCTYHGEGTAPSFSCNHRNGAQSTPQSIKL